MCPDHLAITNWEELSGKGTIYAFSVSQVSPSFYPYEKPYVLAYVALEGVSTLFLHNLRNYGDEDRIRIGMPVKAVYSDEPVSHPLWSMWFEAA